MTVHQLGGKIILFYIPMGLHFHQKLACSLHELCWNPSSTKKTNISIKPCNKNLFFFLTVIYNFFTKSLNKNYTYSIAQHGVRLTVLTELFKPLEGNSLRSLLSCMQMTMKPRWRVQQTPSSVLLLSSWSWRHQLREEKQSLPLLY